MCFSYDLLLEVHTHELGGISPTQIHIGASRNQVQVSHFLLEWCYYLNHGDSYKNLLKVKKLKLVKQPLVKPSKILIDSLKIMEIIIINHVNMYAGIWSVYGEIWFKMLTIGEWNDVKMDGFINKIMASWRPNIPPHQRFFMSSCK